MGRVRAAHDTLTIKKSGWKRGATVGTCIPVHSKEENSPDCPDCFDTMVKLYDWDKVGYRCENCRLTIANPLVLSTMFEEQEIR